ncbi:MAG: HNH endonuclease [Roseovarius sp.]
MVSRKAFIERYGGTCANWNWSWSFVNNTTKVVFFGAWDAHESGEKQTILHDDWEYRGGRRAPGYKQALEHLNLVKNGYALMTFPMKRGLAHEGTDKDTSKILSFEPSLEQRTLQRLGKSWLAVKGPFSNDLSNELDAPKGEYREGSEKWVSSLYHERNSDARAKCLAIKGFNCAVCDINFGERYGAIANNFIHVHHIKPISSYVAEQTVDPEVDLVPLCPNCHAVAHMRKPEPFSVQEVRDLLGVGS